MTCRLDRFVGLLEGCPGVDVDHTTNAASGAARFPLTRGRSTISRLGALVMAGTSGERAPPKGCPRKSCSESIAGTFRTITSERTI
jgi:hypothetical protein